MKKVLFLLTLVCTGITSLAQNTFPTTGNVGIGTLIPNAQLDVKGVASITSLLNLGGYSDVALGASATVSGGILENGGPTYNGQRSLWHVTSPGQYLKIDLKGKIYFNAISFGTYWKGDRLQIPLAYHIDYSEDGSTWNSLISVTDNEQRYIYAHFSRIMGRYLRITIDAFQSGSSTANISSLRVLTSAYSTNFGNNLWSILSGINGNNVVLTTKGNVLIGKTSQTNHSYKLDVNGNIRADKVVVNTTGADYVFDSTYQLPPLDSLEKYIIQHHHLPGIASTEKMQKKGMDLSRTYTKLLEKVEEITRYLIMQSKIIQKQSMEIETLKTLMENKQDSIISN